MRVTNSHQEAVSSYKFYKFAEDKVDITHKEDKAIVVEISQEGRNAIALKDKNEISGDIKALDRKVNYLPEYSGIYSADKAIASAVENCSKEEQAFVYDIIRQNFLIHNISSMTEEERQANISLGMKKAEYAAENFISEDKREAFLKAMETVAKLASAGRANANGAMDYGVKKEKYLGHGSNLINTTDALEVMKTMDKAAYEEYEKISRESSNADRQLNTLKYLTNWYTKAVKKDTHLLDMYEEITDKYVKETVKNQELDNTFENIDVKSKEAFINSLRQFQNQNPNFMTGIINRELSMVFWYK